MKQLPSNSIMAALEAVGLLDMVGAKEPYKRSPGKFIMPAGARKNTPGWIVRNERVREDVNRNADRIEAARLQRLNQKEQAHA